MPITANLEGEISGTLTVPEGVPTGTVLVQFVGDQGSYGETTYTGKTTITVEERRQVTKVTTTAKTVTHVIMQDPLAQTFTLSNSAHIGGIDLWFNNAGTKRVVVQIRETKLGYPTQTILSQGAVYPKNIKTDGNSTRISWNPVFLDAAKEYAIVILTDDPNTSLMIAELGKYDSKNATWVTSQAYQIGVLLSSSNASTWDSHQTADLTFRLLGCKFTSNQLEVDLGELKASNTSDFIALANIERVSSETDVTFKLFDELTGTTHKLSEDFPINLEEKITGKLKAKAILKGTNSRSPVLYPGIQFVFGQILEEADYVTRSIDINSNSTSRVNITYDAFLTGSSDVKVYVKGSKEEKWNSVELNSSQNVGNGWFERIHTVSNFNDDGVQVKLILKGNTLYRPKVQSLKVVVV